MHRHVIVLIVMLLPVLNGGCSADSTSPSATPLTAVSLAASLTGNYTLVVRVDDHCPQITIREWVYQVTLAGGTGNYLPVNVIGGGYSEMTNVGQMYTFADSTARFVWTFGSEEFDVPVGPTRLSLYGSSDTMIRNGAINGTIVGYASTTDNNHPCYGTHSFSLVSTG
jgi:hypothetical protein